VPAAGQKTLPANLAVGGDSVRQIIPSRPFLAISQSQEDWTKGENRIGSANFAGEIRCFRSMAGSRKISPDYGRPLIGWINFERAPSGAIE